MDDKRPIKVFFFGDSICVGQNVSIHKGWVTRTSARLSELVQTYGRDVVVINASVNGSTTRQALERMPYEIQSQDPDILIVQFGMNDCNYWQTDRGVPRVSPNAFGANLEEIIVRAFTFGAKQVLLNTNHPTGRVHQHMPHSTITYQQSNEQYNRIVRQVAALFDDRVLLNDVEAAFKAFTNNDLTALTRLVLPAPDELHLSEAGHDLYFDLIYPKLECAVVGLIEA